MGNLCLLSLWKGWQPHSDASIYLCVSRVNSDVSSFISNFSNLSLSNFSLVKLANFLSFKETIFGVVDFLYCHFCFLPD